MSRTKTITKPLTHYPLAARPWVPYRFTEGLPKGLVTKHTRNCCVVNEAAAQELKSYLDKDVWWQYVGKEFNDKRAHSKMYGQAPRYDRRQVSKADRFNSKNRLKQSLHNYGEDYVEAQVHSFRLKNYWY